MAVALGDGRPGWHIECSAMSEKELGADFAVHGGGIDLVFPHHENEIAQTEAARGVPLAEIWMHNGMVQIDEEKMSKSVGNIFQLSEAVERYGPQAVVAYLVSGHYRQPLAFSDEQLQEAAARVDRIRNYVRDAPSGDPDSFLTEKRQAFLDALADDFNTPQAFAVLFEIVNEGNKRELARSSRGTDRAAPPARARVAAWRRRRRPPRPWGCSPSARRRARPRTSIAPTPCAIGSRRWAGRSATRREAPGSCVVPVPELERIYGRRPVEEAQRGRRHVHRIWRAPETPPEELERLCGSPEHQGVVAEVDPYPYADPEGLLDAEDALVGRARPDSGPPQPGRDRARGRGGGGGRGGDPRAARGFGDRRGLQGVGRCPGASAGGEGQEPGRLARPAPSSAGHGFTVRLRTPSAPTPTWTGQGERCWCWAPRVGGCGRGSPGPATS